MLSMAAFTLVSCSKDSTSTQSKRPSIVGDWDFQQTEYHTVTGNTDNLDSLTTYSEIDTLRFTADGWFYQVHRPFDNDTVPYVVDGDTLRLLDPVDSIPYFQAILEFQNNTLKTSYQLDTNASGYTYHADIFVKVP